MSHTEKSIVKRNPHVGTLPATACLFDSDDDGVGRNGNNECVERTHHYCLLEVDYGATFIDNKRVCGLPFCLPCTFYYEYNSRTVCPHCHPDSSAKIDVSSVSAPKTPVSVAKVAKALYFKSPEVQTPLATSDLADLGMKCKELYDDTLCFFNHLND